MLCVGAASRRGYLPPVRPARRRVSAKPPRLSRLVTTALVLALAWGSSAQSPTAESFARQLAYASSDTLTFDGRAATPLALGEAMAAAGPAGRLFLVDGARGADLYHASVSEAGATRLRRLPLWLSILPPLVVVVLALLVREVISSLFAGVLTGAFIAGGLRLDGVYYALRSVWEVSSGYVIRALNDGGHLSVIVFSMLIGGMVAVISRNGGMAGVVRRLSVLARDRVSAQLSTYLLGVAIFFDDYANTLIVGNTMRQVTDRFGVSREKLAYLVDATAAPIASVAFITTWIGAELGYIQSGFAAIEGLPFDATPYAVFLESLKYSFYPLMTLLFMVILITSGRDYGPMLRAERRAARRSLAGPAERAGGVREPLPLEARTPSDADAGEVAAGLDDEEFSPVDGAPLQARDALLPVLTVVAVTVFGIVDTGLAASADGVRAAGLPAGGYADVWAGLGAATGESAGFFRKLGLVVGAADSYVALLWASLSGLLVAVVLTVARRTLSLAGAMESMLHGFKTMLPAVVILTLAWSLAAATEDLHTATFLAESLEGNLSPVLLPGLVFVLAAVISFSTGSSWSTMAILYPIAIPTTWAVATASGLDVEHCYGLLLNVVSTVLAASVLGDHCSPISDTTILSSLASNCDHLAHVRTQLPYALTVGAFALAANVLSAALGGGGWLLSAALVGGSCAAFWFLVRALGRPVVGEVVP